MEVETLRDVIHWSRGVHLRLGECLAECQSDNVDERAKLVLTYLANYEYKIADVIEIFEQKGGERALNTWCIEYVNKFKINNDRACNKPFSELDVQQIITAVMEEHQYLLSLFQFLAIQAAIPSAKELMKALSYFEEHETMKMMQSLNRFEDM